MRRVVPALLLSLATGAAMAQGLRVDSDPVLQARVLLLSGHEAGGGRVIGAQLLGDYYLIGQGNGLRLSGGLMLGPSSLLASGLAPARPGLLGVGMRRFEGTTEENSQSQPYLGIGYSRYGQAWSFSADLGVAMSGALRLGGPSNLAQSLDESLRRLQLTPMLQLGVSYRF